MASLWLTPPDSLLGMQRFGEPAEALGQGRAPWVQCALRVGVASAHPGSVTGGGVSALRWQAAPSSWRHGAGAPPSYIPGFLTHEWNHVENPCF